VRLSPFDLSASIKRSAWSLSTLGAIVFASSGTKRACQEAEAKREGPCPFERAERRKSKQTTDGPWDLIVLPSLPFWPSHTNDHLRLSHRSHAQFGREAATRTSPLETIYSSAFTPQSSPSFPSLSESESAQRCPSPLRFKQTPAPPPALLPTTPASSRHLRPPSNGFKSTALLLPPPSSAQTTPADTFVSLSLRPSLAFIDKNRPHEMEADNVRKSPCFPAHRFDFEFSQASLLMILHSLLRVVLRPRSHVSRLCFGPRGRRRLRVFLFPPVLVRFRRLHKILCPSIGPPSSLEDPYKREVRPDLPVLPS
jgi:hypothetical protein